MYPSLTKEELVMLVNIAEKGRIENSKICSVCYKQFMEETAVKDVCPECLVSCFVEHGAEAKGCAFCKNLSYEYECDEMGYNNSVWFECAKMPQYACLVTFPFVNTPKKCIEKNCFNPTNVRHYMCK